MMIINQLAITVKRIGDPRIINIGIKKIIETQPPPFKLHPVF